MPKFRVTLSDGRMVTLEADQQPTEADVLMAIGAQSAPQPSGLLNLRPVPAFSDDPNDPRSHPGGVAGWFETELRPMLERVARPETISDIAQLLVPDANLSGVVKAGRQAASAVRQMPMRRPVAAVMDVGSAVLDNPVVGMVSPRLQQGGRFLGRAAEAMRGEPAAVEGAVSAPSYPRLTESPAAAEPVAPPSRPAPAPAEAPAPAARVSNPGTALQMAKDTFAKLGETPRPAEASNAGELIRRGVPPDQAVATVMRNRPKAPLSPVEQLAQMPGAMSDAEVRAALDARNASGQIKSPSAQTARERRGN